MKSALEWKFMGQWVKFYTIFVILLICLGFLGCTTGKQKDKELNVFAAMSLTDALTEIGDQFIAENRIKVYYNFAASTTLQRQIEKGASADVFISASPKQVDALNSLGLLEGDSRSDILANHLVVVSQKNAKITIEKSGTLQDPIISRIAIGQPDIVPAGTYAKEALLHLDLWDKLKPKLIFGTDVRATVAYVSAGNVDLAIVYDTDTKVTDAVKVLYRFSAETHTPIVYPAVILKSSERNQSAEQFIAYLNTSHATEIFEKHGFTCLSSTPVMQNKPDTQQ
jgi:molybdate transport system substrate-binding protein